MMRFSKQMQALAPKQKAIQEKYKDDRVKMQQEMTRLMREEGVNYAGMLGCLPMFLQTPVWIALYAMLYMTFELRHEPAFFGVVQSVFKDWSFLGDLSVGDHFIDFGHSLFSVPMMGDITGINKKGWEYIWVRYADAEDEKVLVKQPIAVYVEKVYDEGNFAGLGIGT